MTTVDPTARPAPGWSAMLMGGPAEGFQSWDMRRGHALMERLK